MSIIRSWSATFTNWETSALRTKYTAILNYYFPPSLRYRTGLDSYDYQSEPVP